MRETAKWAAVALWLTVAFLLGRTLTDQSPRGEQLDIRHPLGFAVKGGQPVIVRCSERIVEGPFVHRNLPYPFRGRVLDVGYRGSQLIYELASLGFETWGIDIRPPLVKFPHVEYVIGDICRYPFPAAYFDVVISLSTIEHIGLQGYGNVDPDPEGDLHALQAMHRALNPNGRLLLTVPFGKPGRTITSRFYDHPSLLALLAGAGFEVETEDYWYQPEMQWIPASREVAEQMDSLTTNITRAVACVRAKPRSNTAIAPSLQK
jgi:SAM-dependent methyltransferase